MGKRVQKGVSEVTMMDSEGKMAVVQAKLQVESIEGFSGHSDRRQLISYLTHLKPTPERIFVCHGEKSKIMNLANFIDKKVGISAIAPEILETFRLL
jgi:predicted metal-dependent RNase